MDFLEGFRFGASQEAAEKATATAAAVREAAAARSNKGALDENERKHHDDDDDEWHVSESEDEAEAGPSGRDIDTKEETLTPVKRERDDDGDDDDDGHREPTDAEHARKRRFANQFLGGSYADAVDADVGADGGADTAVRGVATVAASRFFLPRGHPARGPDPNLAAEPEGWHGTLELIRSARTNKTASVDEFHEFLLSLRHKPDAHFQALVASLLSVQCLDKVALGAMRTLREALGGECTVEAVINAEPETIETAVARCNYRRTKAKYVMACAHEIRLRYGGKVPRQVAGLTRLPGVGPKIAHLVASVAFGDDRAGMVVDTHVRRVAGRIGWTREGVERADAEKTRLRLQAWLPPELWAETTLLLVGFGQEICAPKAPRCIECPLRETCPSARLYLPDVEDL